MSLITKLIQQQHEGNSAIIGKSLAILWKNRLSLLKNSFFHNMKILQKSLIEKDIDLSIIKIVATYTARQLKTDINRLIKTDNAQLKSRIVRNILYTIQHRREQLQEYFGTDIEDTFTTNLISMTFSSYLMLNVIRFLELLPFPPMIMTSIYFAPIFEEISQKLILPNNDENNFKYTNFFGEYKSIFKYFIYNLFVGYTKYPFISILRPIKILYSAYSRLMLNSVVRKFERIEDKIKEEHYKVLNILFICVILGCFLEDIKDNYSRVSKLLADLLNTKVGSGLS